jgi:hypothetical protein
MKTYLLAAIFAVAFLPASAHSSFAQPSAEQSPTVGTVVLVRSDAIIVQTDDRRYLTFVIDENTVRPSGLADGARVRIESTEGSDATGRTATRIAVIGTPPPAGEATSRQVERRVQQTVRHYRLGVRGGVALDPELITMGVHMTLGPIFSPRLLLRPNFEFAFGELTTLWAINAEAIYRLSSTMPRDRWSPYVGGGPSFGFSHRGFSTPTGSDRSFDFGDFDFHAGLNLLAGFEKPSGVFVELKSTIYTDPHLRLLVGYSF